MQPKLVLASNRWVLWAEVVEMFPETSGLSVVAYTYLKSVYEGHELPWHLPKLFCYLPFGTLPDISAEPSSKHEQVWNADRHVLTLITPDNSKQVHPTLKPPLGE